MRMLVQTGRQQRVEAGRYHWYRQYRRYRVGDNELGRCPQVCGSDLASKEGATNVKDPAYKRGGASHDVIALPPIHWRVLRDGNL